MAGPIKGIKRDQVSLFLNSLDDRAPDDRPLDERIDADSGFGWLTSSLMNSPSEASDLPVSGPRGRARPGFHSAVLAKLFLCGYLHRLPSSGLVAQSGEEDSPGEANALVGGHSDKLTYNHIREERGGRIGCDWINSFQSYVPRHRCTTATERRITRWAINTWEMACWRNLARTRIR